MGAINRADIYHAISHATPSVPTPLNEGERVTLKNDLRHFRNQAIKMQEPTVASSLLNNSYVQASPIGTLGVGFFTLLSSTINGWDDASPATQGLEIVGLIFIVGAVAHHRFMNWMSKRQETQAAELRAVIGSYIFLKQSEKMARLCSGLDVGLLKTQFDVFEKSMNQLPAGYADNPLVIKWGEVGHLIKADLVNLPDIVNLVNNSILPMIKDYDVGLRERLTRLGYTRPNPDQGI